MDLANKQAIEVSNYVKRLEDHIEDLRHALGFYANRIHWTVEGEACLADFGAVARAALEQIVE